MDLSLESTEIIELSNQISKLPQKSQQILSLYFVEDLTIEEISYVMDATEEYIIESLENSLEILSVKNKIMEAQMNCYIMFSEAQQGLKGFTYTANVKYKVQSEDENYFRVMNDKVKKVDLVGKNYEIGMIKE